MRTSRYFSLSYPGFAAVSVHKYSELSQPATSCPFRKNHLKILGMNDEKNPITAHECINNICHLALSLG